MPKDLKFQNGLNIDVKVESEVDGTGRKGIGKNGESRVSRRRNANSLGELDFANYKFNKKVTIYIQMDELPSDGKTVGFEYGFGSKIDRVPHDIQIIKKGNMLELIINYDEHHHKTHMDPQIKHPEGL
tara:strand:+ start:7643 stop:8026 length:384 start_codon:yes stop_codon:yes gene_type:complete